MLRPAPNANRRTSLPDRCGSYGSVSLTAVGVAIAIIAGSLQVAAQTVPASWTSVDIGSPSIPGWTVGNGSTFDMVGAGSDVWESSDEFQFAYQALTGD